MRRGIKLQVPRVRAMNEYVGAIIDNKTLCNNLVINIVKAGPFYAWVTFLENVAQIETKFPFKNIVFPGGYGIDSRIPLSV
jgi:hypothetical protein